MNIVMLNKFSKMKFNLKIEVKIIKFECTARNIDN